MLDTVRTLYAAAGTGVLVAGHDPVVVAAADRVVRLGDGRWRTDVLPGRPAAASPPGAATGAP